MKFRLATLVLSIIVIGSNNVTNAESCPDDLISIHSCCKFPVLNSMKDVFEKLSPSLKDEKLDLWMMGCKATEQIFKELKLEKDGMPVKDAFLKFMDAEIKDENWNPILKAATDKCFKDLAADKDKIISEMEKAPLNMKKDKCNVLPLVLMTCVDMEGVLKCPKSSWNDGNVKCSSAKASFENCSDPVEFLKNLVIKAKQPLN